MGGGGNRIEGGSKKLSRTTAGYDESNLTIRKVVEAQKRRTSKYRISGNGKKHEGGWVHCGGGGGEAFFNIKERKVSRGLKKPSLGLPCERRHPNGRVIAVLAWGFHDLKGKGTCSQTKKQEGEGGRPVSAA